MHSITMHKTSCMYIRNELCTTMVVQERENVDSAWCHTFLSGLIGIWSLTFCEFLVGTSRSVVGALHPLEPSRAMGLNHTIQATYCCGPSMSCAVCFSYGVNICA